MKEVIAIKTITICGSMKFAKQMKQISWELEAHKGYCVIQCVYNEEDEPIDEEMIRYMSEAHNKKIDLCDAIYVVDIDGYIGSAVKNEIIYAQGHAKEIILHSKQSSGNNK